MAEGRKDGNIGIKDNVICCCNIGDDVKEEMRIGEVPEKFFEMVMRLLEEWL